MSNRIRETLYAQTASDGSTIYVVANIDCDTSADLPAVNAFTGLTLLMGSRAHDIDQNAWYEMQDGGTWVLQDAGTAAYTKSEVDTLLLGKQDTLAFDTVPTVASTNPVTSGGILNWVYGSAPVQIPASSDLNDYYNIGTYRATSNAIAATLSHCPTQNGFRMEVVSTIAAVATGYQIQRLYPNNSSGEFFMRRRLSAGSGNWGSWFRFSGTEMPTIQTITGIPPITFTSGDGSALTAWEILGNMVSGTPAQVCGDKTENILPPAAAETKTIDGCTVASDGNGVYTISASGGVADTEILFDIEESTMPGNPSAMMALFNSAAVNVQILFYYGASLIDYWGMNQTAYRTMPITSSMSGRTFNKIGFKFLDTNVSETTVQPEVLTLTSVPTDFIPYGYKIPVTLAGTTEIIYIKEPLRKALDGSGETDYISSTGTLTRNVDSNGDALVTPTTETVTVPTLTPTTGSNTLSIGTTLQPSSVSITGNIS